MPTTMSMFVVMYEVTYTIKIILTDMNFSYYSDYRNSKIDIILLPIIIYAIHFFHSKCITSHNYMD